jgi:hypothetical protein
MQPQQAQCLRAGSCKQHAAAAGEVLVSRPQHTAAAHLRAVCSSSSLWSVVAALGRACNGSGGLAGVRVLVSQKVCVCALLA